MAMAREDRQSENKIPVVTNASFNPSVAIDYNQVYRYTCHVRALYFYHSYRHRADTTLNGYQLWEY
jgi:hypothetical protein